MSDDLQIEEDGQDLEADIDWRVGALRAERDWLRARLRIAEAAVSIEAPRKARRFLPCEPCGGDGGRTEGKEFCWTCRGSGMALSWTHHQRWLAAQASVEDLNDALDKARYNVRYLRDGPAELLAYEACRAAILRAEIIDRRARVPETAPWPVHPRDHIAMRVYRAVRDAEGIERGRARMAEMGIDPEEVIPF